MPEIAINKDLQAILNALAYKVDEDGNIEAESHQNIELARQLSTDYVKAHADEFRRFEVFGYSDDGLKQTVKAVEVFRAAGMTEDWARAEAWHFYAFPPQEIGGTQSLTPRNTLPQPVQQQEAKQ